MLCHGVIAMLNLADWERLARLLNDLHLLTGLKFALMDENAREIYTSSFQTPFCRLIALSGDERCLKCDARALADMKGRSLPKRYLCHAGLYEIALPVTEGGRHTGTILFGQMLDDSPREAQWRRVSAKCAWYPDQEALYAAFMQLRRVSAQQMNACAEIAQACVSEARLSGPRLSARHDDAEALFEYVSERYMEPVSLQTLCDALGMGKTKLCALCSRRFGQTPMRLLAERRVSAARELLESTDHSVRFIAQAVGIPDENYFIKVFKRAVGMTPAAYRARVKPE